MRNDVFWYIIGPIIFDQLVHNSSQMIHKWYGSIRFPGAPG